MDRAHPLDALRLRTLAADLPLKEGAHNLVFGKGNPRAKILFIGEAPGEQEDLKGIPFVGAAGRELDKLLRTIGLTLDDVYIANILKYRPPGNRNPNPDEIRAHTPFLVEQIMLIAPRIVCTLGNFSTKFILANGDVDAMDGVPGVSKLHGTPKDVVFQGAPCTVIPLYHPAAMLYKPALRADTEADFKKIGALLGMHAAGAKPRGATLNDY